MSFVKIKKNPQLSCVCFFLVFCLFVWGLFFFISWIYLNKITCDCRSSFKQTPQGHIGPCPVPPSHSWMKGCCMSWGPFPVVVFHPLPSQPKTTQPTQGKPFVFLSCSPLITIKLCVPDQVLHSSAVNSHSRGQCFLGSIENHKWKLTKNIYTYIYIIFFFLRGGNCSSKQ